MAGVTFKGNPVPLEGVFPFKGVKAPNFKLVDGKLEDVGLSAFSGKRKVLTINPSYDTPVCAKAAKEFHERAVSKSDVVVLAISADLPFAQGRVFSAEGIDRFVPLSCFRNRQFGRDYGVLIAEGPLAGLTARAVLVLDQDNKVIHAELVSEIAEEPNYEAALAALG